VLLLKSLSYTGRLEEKTSAGRRTRPVHDLATSLEPRPQRVSDCHRLWLSCLLAAGWCGQTQVSEPL